MKGTADMTNAKEQGLYSPLPEGEYIVEITEIKDKSTRKGDPMVSVKFTIMGGEYEGQWVWDNICFVDEILGRTKHFLHVIGEPYEGEIEWDSDKWINKQLRVVVKNEEYDSKIRNRVVKHDFLTPPGEEANDPLAGQDTPF